MSRFFSMLMLFCVSAFSIAAEQRPNVVVIFVDDLGYADIGPFGATQQKTPRLDRMSAEGMRLTSFYAAPVCSVSRAQLMTGCYGVRVSVPGVFGPGGKLGLHPQEFTVAERLKELGYATACIGKWHLGDQPEFLPTKQGFDTYFGIPYSNDMQRKSTETGQPVVPLVRDESVIELLSDEVQSRIVERYTDEAVRFIRENSDRPFFLYLPHTAVHTPIFPGRAFAGKSNNGRFGDWVEEVDWSVGRVIDTLQEIGIDQRTLVIFTSDNGPWLIKGPDGGSAGPLRGGKGSTWEGGVRVPTIARWPGKIPAGSDCDSVAGTIDLLPTLVKIAGGSVPITPIIDGRDISPLLFGHSQQSPREAHYYFAGVNLHAVRQGPWKLAVATQPETMGKGTVKDAEINPRLYNLDQEIGERTNLADRHPDVVARLTALANEMAREIGGNSPTRRRPAGSVENPRTLYASEPPTPRPKQKQQNKKKAGNQSARKKTTLDSKLASPITISLQSPLDYQVVQRSGRSSGSLPIRGTLQGTDSSSLKESPPVFEARIIDQDPPGAWQTVTVDRQGDLFQGSIPAPAGGWYRFQLRAKVDGQTVARGEVGHVGIGEVFVVAGQSNSANHGEVKQTPKTQRVATFDGSQWRIADDPQPGASGKGGSFMPPLGDELMRRFDLPIGFVACGIGATSVREWLPKGTEFPNPPTIESRVEKLPGGSWASKGEAFAMLVARMQQLGPSGFRAVLWHQGESDANQKDSSRTLSGNLYRQYLAKLIRDSRAEIGWDAPWLVAQVSYHVPGDEASADIREAQSMIWKEGLVFQGPDSDSLTGPLRERGGAGVHFSDQGLRAHGLEWAKKIGPWLEANLTSKPSDF